MEASRNMLQLFLHYPVQGGIKLLRNAATYMGPASLHGVMSEDWRFKILFKFKRYKLIWNQCDISRYLQSVRYIAIFSISAIYRDIFNQRDIPRYFQSARYIAIFLISAIYRDIFNQCDISRYLQSVRYIVIFSISAIYRDIFNQCDISRYLNANGL